MRFARLLVAAVSLARCSSDSATPTVTLGVPDGCQPIGFDATATITCALPYPSDYFRTTDGSGAAHVGLASAARPTTPDGVDADLADAFPTDGASLQPAIVATLPDALVKDGLPNVLDDPSASTDPAHAATLLMRADTGELIAHYADADPHADDELHVAIQLHPFVRLRPSTRYIVAFRGVKNARGSLARPAEGFRRLRDRQTSLDPALLRMTARFDSEVFGVLEAHGVPRANLQLAWDFTTGSEEAPRADLLQTRALTLDWLTSHVPVVKITSITAGTNEVWRVVRGTVTGPLFLDKPEVGGTLFRAGGKVTQNGEVTFPFLAEVPVSLRDQFGPGRALAFGHGFFGDSSEVDGQPARDIVSTLRATAFALDWWGMSKDDLGGIVNDIALRPAHAMDFADRVHQAVVNWLVMTAAIKGPIAKEDAFKRPMSGPGSSTDSGGNSNAGALLYDPSHEYYFGASMGHILGATMVTVNPDLERAVFSAGGAGWTEMMPRAQPFSAFSFFIKSTLQSALATQALEAMSTSELDRIDPATYAPLTLGSKLPMNPDRRVLIQMGLGDPQVPNVANEFHARALGLSQVAPNQSPVWGIPDADPSTLTSGYAIWDFGIDASGYRDPLPLPPNNVHEGVRHDPNAMKQMDAFLSPTGAITNPCNGTCKAK